MTEGFWSYRVSHNGSTLEVHLSHSGIFIGIAEPADGQSGEGKYVVLNDLQALDLAKAIQKLAEGRGPQ